MKPVEFKHQNIVFAKDQPEYQPLSALKIDAPTGEVISCWKLTFKERLKVLVFGRVWMSLMSFNKPLTPSYLAVNRKEVFSHPDDKIKWYKKFLKLVKLRQKARYFLYTLLAVVLLQSCDMPTQYIQLQKNKPFIVITEITLHNGNNLGKYKYFGRDNSGMIAIYLDEKLNIGDTIWIGSNKR